VSSKLYFVCPLVAAALFFLPWIVVEWNGQRSATQTGIQMILGSASAEVETVRPASEAKGKPSLGHSYLVVVALFSGLAAALIGCAGLVTGRKDHQVGSGVLCSLALAMLISQAAQDFPVKKAVLREIAERRQASAGKLPDGLEDFLLALSNPPAVPLQTPPTPWFYIELAMLAVPAGLLFNSFLDRIKAKGT
jgi:hypothetical protein